MTSSKVLTICFAPRGIHRQNVLTGNRREGRHRSRGLGKVRPPQVAWRPRDPSPSTLSFEYSSPLQMTLQLFAHKNC